MHAAAATVLEQEEICPMLDHLAACGVGTEI